MRARRLVLAAAVSVLLMAESAQAQVRFVTFGRPGGTTFGPLGFGGFSPNIYGGIGYPGFGFPAAGYPGWYGPGTTPGWGGWSPYAAYHSGPTVWPGWAVSSSVGTPRMRPTLHPAVAVDPERIREAARPEKEGEPLGMPKKSPPRKPLN